MDSYLDTIVITLVQPQDTVNIAGVIRVMSNFGLPSLRLVEPAAFDPQRILGIAHHTERIVQESRQFATLNEALADCTFVLGTAGRVRGGKRRLLTPRTAAPLLLQMGSAAPNRKVAILFGSEQNGLPNEALNRCHGFITIPTHPQNMSLNLAQAVLVIAYELWLTATAGSGTEPTRQVAGADQTEPMFTALERMLWALYPGTTEVRLNAAMTRLRTLLMRAAPGAEEAAALTNLCRHAARALERNSLETKPPTK